MLCGFDCLDMAVKCHLFSPASVTLEFFSCSSRVVFLGMAYSSYFVQVRRCTVQEGISLLMKQGFGKIQGFQVSNSCSLPLKDRFVHLLVMGKFERFFKCILTLSLFFVEGIFIFMS